MNQWEQVKAYFDLTNMKQRHPPLAIIIIGLVTVFLVFRFLVM